MVPDDPYRGNGIGGVVTLLQGIEGNPAVLPPGLLSREIKLDGRWHDVEAKEGPAST